MVSITGCVSFTTAGRVYGAGCTGFSTSFVCDGGGGGGVDESI